MANKRKVFVRSEDHSSDYKPSPPTTSTTNNPNLSQSSAKRKQALRERGGLFVNNNAVDVLLEGEDSFSFNFEHERKPTFFGGVSKVCVANPEDELSPLEIPVCHSTYLQNTGSD